jgi:hypothetical protein
MALRTTRSKVSSNPKINDAIIVGEGDERRGRDLPIEQLEVSEPELIPKSEPVQQTKQNVPLRKNQDDTPIEKAIQISQSIKITPTALAGGRILTNGIINSTLNQQAIALPERNKAGIESRINLVSGNIKATRIEERRPQQTAAIQPLQLSRSLLETSNLFEKFNDQFNSTVEAPISDVPEAKVLAMIDLSRMKPQEIEELLVARKFESELDDKLLKSIFAIMENDQKNADYIYELETQILDEIKSAESALNTVTSFESLMDTTILSLLIGQNSRSLYEKLQEKIKLYNVKANSNQELEINFENSFVKVFEKINAMENASNVDPQFLVWKNLKSVSELMRNGVSNRFLAEEQPKQGFSLEYLNFDYDGTESSFDQFKIMNLNSFEPLERIFYYINCMCNELNQSIGLGTLQTTQSNLRNGNDWLRKNFGLKNNWQNYVADSGIYRNFFVDDLNNEKKPQLNLSLNGAFNSYLTDFKKNVRSNSYSKYDDSLIKLLQELQNFESEVQNVSNIQDSKKKLLNPALLFKRILESFNDIISNINQSTNVNDQNNNKKIMSLLLLSITSGDLTSHRLKFKYEIFNLMLNSLSKIREERKSNDLKMSLNSVAADLNKSIKALKQTCEKSSFSDFSFRFKSDDLQELLTIISNGNLKNDIVFHKIIEIFLELEKECIDTINKNNLDVEFLTEDDANKNGKTKFSNLDANKFCYMLYEIFGILTQVFLQFSVNDEFKVKWSIISDEIKQSLKILPKCFEKDEFQSFYDSLKTFTVNDNLGFRTNVYGGIVTARNFYELNESFKKEQATMVYHLASTKVVIENFISATNKLSNYAKILKQDSSVQEASLSAEQKNLKTFLSTDIGKNFLDGINKLKIARAKLRLLKLKSLVKPFDLAATQPAFYEALQIYVSKNDRFKSNNLMFLTQLQQEVLKNLVNVDYSKRFKMNLRITKVNEFQDIPYEPLIVSNIPLGYCLTKDLLDEAMLNSKTRGLNEIPTFGDLMSNIKFFDMSNSRILNSIEMTSTLNINDDAKRNLVDSYLATALIETIARIDLDMPGTFKNDVGYNADVVRRMMDIAGNALGIENAFETIFKVNGGNIILKDKQEIQRNFAAESNFVSEKGTVLQLNDGFDFAKIDLLHTLLDTIYVRKGKLKEMIFTDNSVAQIFSITFDPKNFNYEDDFTADDDNEMRFDSFYLETEFTR